MSFITVKNLSFKYPSGIENVLNDVSLEVKKGEKVEKTEELGKWIKVKKDNTIGWILSTEVE